MLHIILLHILCEQNTITCLLIVPAKRYLDRIFLLASVCCFFFTGISIWCTQNCSEFSYRDWLSNLCCWDITYMVIYWCDLLYCFTWCRHLNIMTFCVLKCEKLTFRQRIKGGKGHTETVKGIQSCFILGMKSNILNLRTRIHSMRFQQLLGIVYQNHKTKIYYPFPGSISIIRQKNHQVIEHYYSFIGVVWY